ncbi:MAG: hypothetical protein U0X76_12540 [Bacteroidia bacterium]
MNILLLDNYDSFTYNLKHQLEGFDVDVDVRRNDEIEVADVAVYDRIVLSPGPGVPSEAGKMMEVISRYKHEKKFSACVWVCRRWRNQKEGSFSI